jgi:hypothetical protein
LSLSVIELRASNFMTVIQAPAPVRDTDVTIAIYKQSGRRVTIAHGDEKRLRLQRGRWVRHGSSPA